MSISLTMVSTARWLQQGRRQSCGSGGREKESEKADAAVVLAAPLPPSDVLAGLPKAPKALLAFPGMTADSLKKVPDVNPTSYSKRLLARSFDKGPFRMIHYLLNEEKTHVESVVATLHRAYEVKGGMTP